MVISREQKGKIRSLRNITFSILIPIYFGLPWLRWDGHPFIRLDIPERKFYLMGNVFIPMEGYFLWLFLISAGLSLFFFTSLVGRVWCGWACPQTIFTEVFDWIGRKIAGKKYGKKDCPTYLKALVHAAWILFAIYGSLTWVAYFADPYLMIEDVRSGAIWQGNVLWPYFTAFFTFTFYGDMAFVREQFCKYACPYARFQTVLMDNQSYNVTYDYVRGEPRRKGKERIGDCIACNMCLVVCPTGIDIRDGLNVGCIACGKCVDACTSIMAKEGKESLIRYMSQEQVENRTAKIRWIRPRTLVYGSLLLAVLVTVSVLLYNRVPIYVSIIPDRAILPMALPENRVRNFYSVKLQNISLKDQNIHMEIVNTDFKSPLVLRVGGTDDQSNIFVPKNTMQDLRIIVETSPLSLEEQMKPTHTITIQVKDLNNPKYIKEKTVPFSLPSNLMGMRGDEI